MILEDLEEICFILIKMTIFDQIKILGSEAQYDLDRKAAKISALSSENLDKYEYFTGEDLDYKPSAIKKTKFEYSPSGRVFNRGLKDGPTRKDL